MGVERKLWVTTRATPQDAEDHAISWPKALGCSWLKALRSFGRRPFRHRSLGQRRQRPRTWKTMLFLAEGLTEFLAEGLFVTVAWGNAGNAPGRGRTYRFFLGRRPYSRLASEPSHSISCVRHFLLVQNRRNSPWKDRVRWRSSWSSTGTRPSPGAFSPNFLFISFIQNRFRHRPRHGGSTMAEGGGKWVGSSRTGPTECDGGPSSGNGRSGASGGVSIADTLDARTGVPVSARPGDSWRLFCAPIPVSSLFFSGADR